VAVKSCWGANQTRQVVAVIYFSPAKPNLERDLKPLRSAAKRHEYSRPGPLPAAARRCIPRLGDVGCFQHSCSESGTGAACQSYLTPAHEVGSLSCGWPLGCGLKVPAFTHNPGGRIAGSAVNLDLQPHRTQPEPGGPLRAGARQPAGQRGRHRSRALRWRGMSRPVLPASFQRLLIEAISRCCDRG